MKSTLERRVKSSEVVRAEPNSVEHRLAAHTAARPRAVRRQCAGAWASKTHAVGRGEREGVAQAEGRRIPSGAEATGASCGPGWRCGVGVDRWRCSWRAAVHDRSGGWARLQCAHRPSGGCAEAYSWELVEDQHEPVKGRGCQKESMQAGGRGAGWRLPPPRPPVLTAYTSVALVPSTRTRSVRRGQCNSCDVPHRLRRPILNGRERACQLSSEAGACARPACRRRQVAAYSVPVPQG